MKRTIDYSPVRARKADSLRDFLAVRGTDGAYRQSLRCAYQSFRREPTGVRLCVFGVHLLRMLLGDRLMNAVLSDRAAVVTGVYDGGDRLYHFAPTDCVQQILARGLLPRDRYVYLTDAPNRMAQDFLPWKTAQIRATTAFTLFCVDARRLSKQQKVFSTDRPHEYVTGRIAAEFLSIVPEEHDGRIS